MLWFNNLIVYSQKDFSMFNDSDLRQFHEKGMTTEDIENQIDHFRKGFPFIDLAKPATPSDGIICLTDEEKKRFISYYDDAGRNSGIIKFVPASGAASRMFKHLFEFREKYKPGSVGENLLKKDTGPDSVNYYIDHLKEIAFYDELSLRLKRDGLIIENLLNAKDFATIIDYILTEKGLDYANLPKGLVRFHDYPEGARTSAEEHMVEAALYASNLEGIARLHFTISAGHRARFEDLVNTVRPLYESRFNVSYQIGYSVQKPSTDTIAVDEENNPFRNADGHLLFRPGGHGALLENLNEIDADMIFIKNIDNIVPDRLKPPTVLHKKLIGGYLAWIRRNIFGFLDKVRQNNCTADDIASMADFAGSKLSMKIPAMFDAMTVSEKTSLLFKMLNRPVRVCGMVKNAGEPGGGPFWVRDKQGEISLQIVESSQVDMKNSTQKKIFSGATHFNPVDLVCGIRDFQGNKFDLNRYVDEETGFIAMKSSGGRNLKALERPGLWNGAMAGWITVFMEVPITTFNPVKTMNDLLRKEHLKE